MNKHELIEKMKDELQTFKMLCKKFNCSIDVAEGVRTTYQNCIELAQQLDEPSEAMGECEFSEDKNYCGDNAQCSNCKFHFTSMWDDLTTFNLLNNNSGWNFCPSCGAIIIGSEAWKKWQEKIKRGGE